MCSTPWCAGECEDCQYEKRYNEEQEEARAECPHRKECNWVVVDVKTDKCTTCGKTTNY